MKIEHEHNTKKISDFLIHTLSCRRHLYCFLSVNFISGICNISEIIDIRADAADFADSRKSLIFYLTCTFLYSK